MKKLLKYITYIFFLCICIMVTSSQFNHVEEKDKTIINKNPQTPIDIILQKDIPQGSYIISQYNQPLDIKKYTYSEEYKNGVLKSVTTGPDFENKEFVVDKKVLATEETIPMFNGIEIYIDQNLKQKIKEDELLKSISKVNNTKAKIVWMSFIVKDVNHKTEYDLNHVLWLIIIVSSVMILYLIIKMIDMIPSKQKVSIRVQQHIQIYS